MVQASRVLSRSEHFRPGGLPLAVRRVTEHRECAVHGHEFSEIVVVLRGTGRHVTGQGEWAIGAGDAFVIHPSQAHGYFNTAGLDLVNILFDLAELGLPRADVATLPGYHVLFDLEPRYRERDQFRSRLRLGPQRLRPIAGLLDRLESELESGAPGAQFAALASFMLLVCDLCRAYAEVDNPDAQPLLQLAGLISYLDQHYAEPLTLDDLARVACLSRRSLTRAFRGAYGDSPIEYLIRLRLDRAAELLGATDLPVLAVAQRVGFADSNYFARAFRQRYGTTPTGWRAAR